jgi:uncharacterized protein YwgA
MNAVDFLISLVDASGGSIPGRTLLQKRAYFAQVLAGVDIDLDYDAHFYGPYSPIVDNTITNLKNLCFLQESAIAYGVNNTGFEMKRYDYRLTPDGQAIASRLRDTPEYMKIREAVNRLSVAGNLNYMELSVAAKAFFILKRKKEGLSRAEIAAEARKFDWNIPVESLETAVSFLERLGVLIH